MGSVRQYDPEPLCATVQRNCHISDARHASNYTLCVYLLKMREYYRWEMGYPFGASMSKDELGSWLTEREHLWETLEEESYAPIGIDGQLLDPFDTEAINRALLPKGYVYSGGIGRRATPHFFLASLDSRVDYKGFTVLISADECARDLTAPPAMTLDKTVFVRRESLKRILWEKVQEWRWHQHENPMSRALSCYDFDTNLDAALDAMTANELEAVTLHEIGEIMAGEHLGEAWHEMLIALPPSRGETMARAVRDHVADALSTLPRLLDNENVPSLHFYMANLSAMRKELYPGFANAYQQWLDSERLDSLNALISQSKGHWLCVAQQMLELYDRYGTECIPHMERLLESSRL